MRVGFNARPLSAPKLRGWTRYAVNLLAELPVLGITPFLYSDTPLNPAHLDRLPPGSFVTRIAPTMRYVRFEQQWLPSRCDADGIQVLHSPFNFGLPWRTACPKVLTLHDVIDRACAAERPHWSKKFGRAALQNRFHHWVAYHTADHIVTVSEHARNDIMLHLKVPAPRITAILEAADPMFLGHVSQSERDRARDTFRLQRPYVLYIGGWDPRKNVPFLLDAFAAAKLSGVDLVLVGGHDLEQSVLAARSRALGIEDRVRLIGWVDDIFLPALYAEALCFVNPSCYEGFGLQLCEAMAVGCPTLAARATSFPEVLGDGGALFSLQDASELIGQLRDITGSPRRRAELAERGRVRSAALSWRRTAERTAEVYGRLQ